MVSAPTPSWELPMSINATSSLITTPAGTQSTGTSAQSTTSSGQSGSTGQAASGSGEKSGGSGGGGSAKTVVSEVSITVNGTTTTTITYSDGTSEVETTPSAQNSQTSAGKTYTAQGTISGGANSNQSGSQTQTPALAS
jgi:hypothetical protein